MSKKAGDMKDKINIRLLAFICALGAFVLVVIFLIPSKYELQFGVGTAADATSTPVVVALPPLDKDAYDKKILSISHVSLSTTTVATSTATTTTVKKLWPPKIVYPNAGAILPFKRIIAYYGNFYSKGMGVLGQYPQDVVIQKLQAELATWNAADPATPSIPAINYIVTTAQLDAGKDGKYRLRMPDKEIDKAVALAKKVNGIVILDVQVGLSNLQAELPALEKYLKMPEVHLGLDPEFAMHDGVRPGRVIGSFDANEINYAANYLAKLVQENNLPPKVMIVHRFTQNMVTGYKRITPLPEVQIVMDMDGWGSPAKKKGTYQHVIYPEPVQFTGFKLFYKNDLLAPSTRMLTPAELLALTPQPMFIQYQ